MSCLCLQLSCNESFVADEKVMLLSAFFQHACVLDFSDVDSVSVTDPLASMDRCCNRCCKHLLILLYAYLVVQHNSRSLCVRVCICCSFKVSI